MKRLLVWVQRAWKDYVDTLNSGFDASTPDRVVIGIHGFPIYCAAAKRKQPEDQEEKEHS